MTDRKSYDVAVIGAGTFGAWTAYYLAKSGASVALLDAYGPANSRASSGGESRIIRMGYGADDIYTRWSLRALPRWKEMFAQAGRPELFQPTGVLWIAHAKYPYAMDTLTALQNNKIPHERLSLIGPAQALPANRVRRRRLGHPRTRKRRPDGPSRRTNRRREVPENRRAISRRLRPRAFRRRPRRFHHDQPRRKYFRRRLRLRLRPLAGEAFPRPSWPAHLRLASGNYLFRRAARAKFNFARKPCPPGSI